MQTTVADVVSVLLCLCVGRENLVVLVVPRICVLGGLVHVSLLDDLPWHHFPPLIRRDGAFLVAWLRQRWALLYMSQIFGIPLQLDLALAAGPIPPHVLMTCLLRQVLLVLSGALPLAFLLLFNLGGECRDLRVIIILHLLKIPRELRRRLSERAAARAPRQPRVIGAVILLPSLHGLVRRARADAIIQVLVGVNVRQALRCQPLLEQ